MDQAEERTPTLVELYANIEHAKLMLRQSSSIEERIWWRNEIGRLTQAIRRAGMDGQR